MYSHFWSMLLWLISPLMLLDPEPIPARRLLMLLMLVMLPPAMRAARLDRLGLEPNMPPLKGLPILGAPAPPGTSLIISKP